MVSEVHLGQKLADTTQALLEDAVVRLTAAGAKKAQIAAFVPAKRKFLISKKAHFTNLVKAWPLGVFLLTEDGELYSVGETTRAVDPGYPGHVSAERERRREFTRIAFASGYPAGEVVYFACTKISIEEGASLPDGSPLIIVNGELRVLWNPGIPAAAATPFASYLAEQVDLRLKFA